MDQMTFEYVEYLCPELQETVDILITFHVLKDSTTLPISMNCGQQWNRCPLAKSISPTEKTFDYELCPAYSNLKANGHL